MLFYKKIEEVFKKEGLNFIKALLKYEQDRFDKHFIKGSVYEDINQLFGIFPKEKQYPIYFTGEITEPKNKYLFIGINPGFNDIKGQKDEQNFLEKAGIFEGDRQLFLYFKKFSHGSSQYYSNIKGFLKRLYKIQETINFDWFHKNLINLELVPYHSNNTAGLHINDTEFYRKFYFEALLKIIDHIDPQKPIFINGFSGFEGDFVKEIFKDVITFEKYKNIWIGKIGRKKKYKFVGLPFLTRVKGGKDNLVKIIRKYL